MKLIQLTDYSPKAVTEGIELDVNVDHIRWFKPHLNRTVIRMGDDLIHVAEDADIVRLRIEKACLMPQPMLIRLRNWILEKVGR